MPAAVPAAVAVAVAVAVAAAAAMAAFVESLISLQVLKRLLSLLVIFQNMENEGNAMSCPNCGVILLKKWGCDWLRCLYCRSEICWVTRQLRWGPNVSI